MATSSTSVESDKYTNLEPDATFILHIPKEGNDYSIGERILVETEADITLFLHESDLKSGKIDPRKYHWHCIHKGSYFHLRNAFSGNIFQEDGYGPDGNGGYRLETREEDIEDNGAFCVLRESTIHSILYRISEGQLFPVSFSHDLRFLVAYPKCFWEVQEHLIVHWKFERVESAMVDGAEVKYGPSTYGL